MLPGTLAKLALLQAEGRQVEAPEQGVGTSISSVGDDEFEGPCLEDPLCFRRMQDAPGGVPVFGMDVFLWTENHDVEPRSSKVKGFASSGRANGKQISTSLTSALDQAWDSQLWELI